MRDIKLILLRFQDAGNERLSPRQAMGMRGRGGAAMA